MERIAEIRSHELTAFLDYMQRIIEVNSSAHPPYRLSVWLDGTEGLKVKVDNHGWSRPYGRIIEAP